MRALLLLALFVATPALAQTQEGTRRGGRATIMTPPTGSKQAPLTAPMPIVIAEPVAMMIAGFDGDGDARVTRAEFDAALRRSFDSVDPSGTGSIGYLGFSDWAERWMGDRNTLPSPFEADRDGDNRITFVELAAKLDAYFTRFDSDKDGVLTRRELVTIRQQQPPRGGQREAAPPRRN